MKIDGYQTHTFAIYSVYNLHVNGLPTTCDLITNHWTRQPAAQYCIDNGGTLEIVKKDDGETGVCTLADGEKIDSWALFHRDHQ